MSYKAIIFLFTQALFIQIISTSCIVTTYNIPFSTYICGTSPNARAYLEPGTNQWVKESITLLEPKRSWSELWTTSLLSDPLMDNIPISIRGIPETSVSFEPITSQMAKEAITPFESNKYTTATSDRSSIPEVTTQSLYFLPDMEWATEALSPLEPKRPLITAWATSSIHDLPVTTAEWAITLAALEASHGGGLSVTSRSVTAPTGVALTSKNVYDGFLGVSGVLPYLGVVALEGVLPTAGTGFVSYGT